MDIQTYKLTTPCLATHVPPIVMLMPDYEIKEIAGDLQKCGILKMISFF